MGGVARRRRGRPWGVDQLCSGLEARVDRGHQQRWEVNTRNPDPEIRIPDPETWNPKPETRTRNPKLQTQNPKPGSRIPGSGRALLWCRNLVGPWSPAALGGEYPKPETRVLKPEIRNLKLEPGHRNLKSGNSRTENRVPKTETRILDPWEWTSCALVSKLGWTVVTSSAGRYTRDPKPGSRNPKSGSRNLESENRIPNSKPETRTLKPGFRIPGSGPAARSCRSSGGPWRLAALGGKYPKPRSRNPKLSRELGTRGVTQLRSRVKTRVDRGHQQRWKVNTRNLDPETRNLVAETRNPNPEPGTRNPRPENRKPGPETRNPDSG